MDIGNIIRIPGKVKAKERPRRGRYGNFYTPKNTHNYEELVGWYTKQSGLKPFNKTDSLDVDIVFYGDYKLADIDNLIKTILDGFKDYFNDNRVTKISASKILCKEYLTDVRISPVLNTP